MRPKCNKEDRIFTLNKGSKDEKFLSHKTERRNFRLTRREVRHVTKVNLFLHNFPIMLDYKSSGCLYHFIKKYSHFMFTGLLISGLLLHHLTENFYSSEKSSNKSIR